MDYDRPWPAFYITGERTNWWAVVEPGPENELPAHEYHRAYEMVWFYHQLQNGAKTLKPAASIILMDGSGWRAWVSDE